MIIMRMFERKFSNSTNSIILMLRLQSEFVYNTLYQIFGEKSRDATR
jgi:hypothetical protein